MCNEIHLPFSNSPFPTFPFPSLPSSTRPYLPLSLQTFSFLPCLSSFLPFLFPNYPLSFLSSSLPLTFPTLPSPFSLSLFLSSSLTSFHPLFLGLCFLDFIHPRLLGIQLFQRWLKYVYGILRHKLGGSVILSDLEENLDLLNHNINKNKEHICCKISFNAKYHSS